MNLRDKLEWLRLAGLLRLAGASDGWVLYWTGPTDPHTHMRGRSDLDDAVNATITNILAERAEKVIGKEGLALMTDEGWRLELPISPAAIAQQCYGDPRLDVDHLTQLLALGVTFVREEVQS